MIIADELGQALGDLLERSFREDNFWHGALWQHVTDLTAEQALWRPTPERHCVWEIVRHVTFWRRCLLEWYAGRPRPDVASNNWTLPEARDEGAWREDLAALEKVQEEVRGLFQSADPQALLARGDDGKYGKFVYLTGILTHDSYHTGQIAILRASMGLPPID